MATITGTINGHSVNLTQLPAWSKDNSYLLWMLYREILAVHARYPIGSVTITKEGSSPPHYHAIIDMLENGDWTLNFMFDDLLNPKFGIFESSYVTWRWNQVEASRGLRSAIANLLIANPSMIDSLVITIA